MSRGYWVWSIEYGVLSNEYWVIGIEYSGIDYWVLTIDYWLLFIEYWLLNFDYWILVIEDWVLVIEDWIPANASKSAGHASLPANASKSARPFKNFQKEIVFLILFDIRSPNTGNRIWQSHLTITLTVTFGNHIWQSPLTITNNKTKKTNWKKNIFFEIFLIFYKNWKGKSDHNGGINSEYETKI